MVKAYSTYFAILARPWLHVMRAVSSTLHFKVKYPMQGRVGELVGNQAMARQFLVAVVMQHSMDQALVVKEQIP